MSKTALLSLVAMLPEEIMFDMLEDAFNEHKLAQTKETKKKLASACVMYSFKVGTENENMEKITKTLNSFDKACEVVKKMEGDN